MVVSHKEAPTGFNAAMETTQPVRALDGLSAFPYVVIDLTSLTFLPSTNLCGKRFSNRFETPVAIPQSQSIRIRNRLTWLGESTNKEAVP